MANYPLVAALFLRWVERLGPGLAAPKTVSGFGVKTENKTGERFSRPQIIYLPVPPDGVKRRYLIALRSEAAAAVGCIRRKSVLIEP
jgi:hypothetical protein